MSGVVPFLGSRECKMGIQRHSHDWLPREKETHSAEQVKSPSRQKRVECSTYLQGGRGKVASDQGRTSSRGIC